MCVKIKDNLSKSVGDASDVFWFCGQCVEVVKQNLRLIEDINAIKKSAEAAERRSDECFKAIVEMKKQLATGMEKNKNIEVTSSQVNMHKGTFADILRNTQNYGIQANSQSPTLIIKPKQKQNSERTKKDLKEKILPERLNIGIKNIRETKQGSIVIKCTNQNDIDKLKEAAEGDLSENYSIETLKLNLPRMKIVGYGGSLSAKQLEDVVRRQNTWIENEDKINFTYVKKIKNKNTSTIFFECSPKLYWKMINIKKICIGWERHNVYENLSINRCFNCQEYYHKSGQCEREVSCEHCADNHESSTCMQGTPKKCKNCVIANEKFKTNHNTAHAASDPECPSTKYHIDLLRSRINYAA